MSDDFRRHRAGPGRQARAPGRPKFDDLEESPRRGRSARRAPPPQREESFWSRLFGSSRAGTRRRVRVDDRFDWAVSEEDDDRPRRGRFEEDDSGDDRYEDEAPRRRAAPERTASQGRQTLMDLSTPILGYAAILPRDPAGMHPGYAQFRQEVLSALARIENDAAEHGIDKEDAADAKFALALFIDEQIFGSEWSGKENWTREPLSMTLLGDPEGGVNFFRRLEGFGERQRAVKEVYLVCLAMGYRGKYAVEDPVQQASRLGEIRQKLVRSIHKEPLDRMDVLFPEGYTTAAPLEDEAPPPPKWWVGASIGLVVFSIALWVLLAWAAGRAPDDAAEAVRQVRERADTPGGSR